MRMRREVFILAIDDILPNRFQPRIKFDEKAIMELAESIKKFGVIQPIIVRKISNKYEIIAGERRYKASIIAGRKTIPAIITDVDDKESAEIALIENVQRQDMTPIEEAISYKKILDVGYITQTELAIKLGKTQSTIANKLRLLNLSEEVQDALLEEKISERHARSLLRVDKKDQPEMLNRIINERLTVRKTDQLINKYLEEKGNNMNNEEINNNYNIPSQPIIDQTNPSFMNVSNIEEKAQDIAPKEEPKPLFNPFGGMEVKEAPVVPTEPQAAPVQEQPSYQNPFEVPSAPVEPTPAVQPEPIQPVNPFEFPKTNTEAPNPFGETTETVQPVNPFEVPSAPVEPAPAVQPEPVQPVNPFEIPSTPVEPQPVQPVNPFGTQAPVQEQPSYQNPFEVPSAPVEPTPAAQPEPVQPSNPFGISSEPVLNTQNNFASTPNYPIPETQELTPLMPEQQSGPTVSINEVINEIRNSLSKIEQYGYKIDSDELDLPDSYEFTIKIQK